MADINPPARTRIRPAVTATNLPVSPTPRVRVRTRPVDHTQHIEVQPRTRYRENPWAIPAGARPLGVLQKTHNGVDPRGGEYPDPRFKPLLIVLGDAHRRDLTSYVAARFDAAMKLTVEEAGKLWAPTAANDYIVEWALRHNLGYKALPDAIYDAIRQRLFDVWDTKDKNEALHPVYKCILTKSEDGDLLVDLNKASGPYYCESALGIELHRKKNLVPMQRVAA